MNEGFWEWIHDLVQGELYRQSQQKKDAQLRDWPYKIEGEKIKESYRISVNPAQIEKKILKETLPKVGPKYEFKLPKM